MSTCQTDAFVQGKHKITIVTAGLAILMLFAFTFAVAAGSGTGVCGAGQNEMGTGNPAQQLSNVLQMSGKLTSYLDTQGATAAIVARVGSDLSGERFRSPDQQKYTHAGIILKKPAAGWTFMHVLNTCAGPFSDIYVQSVANFFTDDPYAYDIRVGIPTEALQSRIIEVLLGDQGLASALHQHRYSNIASPFNGKYQNSNEWVLTVIAAAQSQLATIEENQRYYQRAGYVPSQVHVAGMRRFMKGLGDIFGASPKNVQFGDHNWQERRTKWYNFVSAASLYSYVELTNELIGDETLCHSAGCGRPVDTLE